MEEQWMDLKIDKEFGGLSSYAKYCERAEN
jgi:hypothetical protein